MESHHTIFLFVECIVAEDMSSLKRETLHFVDCISPKKTMVFVWYIVNKHPFDLMGRKAPMFHCIFGFFSGDAAQKHCNWKDHRWVGCPCIYFLPVSLNQILKLSGKNVARNKGGTLAVPRGLTYRAVESQGLKSK